jgi:hypothetical protein
MARDERRVLWQHDVQIVEKGKPFALRLTLFKSRLVVSDAEDNWIAVDKRKGRMAIERRGNVDWHLEAQSRHRRVRPTQRRATDGERRSRAAVEQ